MVEATGLEPTTSWSLTKRATKLRYASMLSCEQHDKLYLNFFILSSDFIPFFVFIFNFFQLDIIFSVEYNVRMNIIFNRYSVRRFKTEKVEKEKIQALLRAAMCAPTAGNQREWEFIVVDDPKLLSLLATVSPYSKPVEQAPLAIITLINTSLCKYPENAEQDLGAACENILLAAEGQGLGGVWLGVAPLKERMDRVAEIFHLPETVRPFSVLAIGYAKEEPPKRERFDGTKIHYNRY